MSHLFNFMSMGIDEKEILEVIGERTRDIERDAETEYGEYDEYDEFIPGTVPWEVFGHAVEVVLTDDQMPDFGPKLKKAGFKHVFRWLNDNSGNYCNLLVYKSSDEDENNPPDFNWEEM